MFSAIYRPLKLLLPGPQRRRGPTWYAYRLLFRNPDQEGAGCTMLWEVTGGRMAYQIALERDEQNEAHVHCTCADAVFRAEPEGRFCKHIHGLLSLGKTDAPEKGYGGVAPADRESFGSGTLCN
jgi:hypothetical protein